MTLTAAAWLWSAAVSAQSIELAPSASEIDSRWPIALQPGAGSLPGERPRLMMSLPLVDQRGFSAEPTRRSAFSWSLEAWQLNTASLAHIRCHSHTMTLDSFLAQDCRFVDEPVPDNSLNLMQVRGEWLAAPGVSLGVGVFGGRPDGGTRPGADQFSPLPSYSGLPGLQSTGLSAPRGMDGVDLNLSFGISTDRVGDFLVGLQLARYRQRMSMVELGLTSDPINAFADVYYGSSAQLALGWRMGSFSTDVTGSHYRDSGLLRASPGSNSAFNSFDLEFSWRPRNASLSIGISNVLDASPRLDEADGLIDDPLENVFGRIPYVRYKHDL